MVGYFSNDVLHVSVTNMSSFKELIERADKEAQQLQKTINELSYFRLQFKFTEDSATCAE